MFFEKRVRFEFEFTMIEETGFAGLQVLFLNI